MLTQLAIQWGVISATFLVGALAFPGVKFSRWPMAFVAAIAYGVATLLIGWPILWLGKLFLFPLNFLSFGLLGALLVIPVNMIVLKVADHWLEEEFKIESFSALFGLALLTAFSRLLV